jgi:hypothetical protein
LCLPFSGNFTPNFVIAGLDEQAKEKAKSILEQEKSGKLTREQAKEELTKLGDPFPGTSRLILLILLLPVLVLIYQTSLALKWTSLDLDDATKQKVKTIMDDTKKQLEELGVKLPEKEKLYT